MVVDGECPECGNCRQNVVDGELNRSCTYCKEMWRDDSPITNPSRTQAEWQAELDAALTREADLRYRLGKRRDWFWAYQGQRKEFLALLDSLIGKFTDRGMAKPFYDRTGGVRQLFATRQEARNAIVERVLAKAPVGKEECAAQLDRIAQGVDLQ